MLGLIKCITRGILKLDPMARFLCKGLGEAVWFQVFLLYPHMALFFCGQPFARVSQSDYFKSFKEIK